MNWRFCVKCQVMFFDGYPNKGSCAGGGGHQAAGYMFVLPHDVPGTLRAQNNWRFCGKCQAMFFDGYPDKGRCPVGGGHAAIGYNFVLAHPIHPVLDLQDHVTSVLIGGRSFTPNSQVKIYYNYKDEFGLHGRGPDNPILITTDNESSFTGVSFNLQSGSRAFNIAVKAVDAITNQEAVAFLRGGS
jgi:hypothetical protein